MTEEQLDRICNNSPDCGCNCAKCEAMAMYQRSLLRYDEENDEEY